jgi:tetratricopeptide (TPR) repeat protein
MSLMAYDTDLGPLQRMLTETRVIVIYLVLLFFPHHERFNLDYNIAISQSLLAPGSTLISTILLAGLLTAAVLLSKKHRLAAFGLLWWFINIALEASFLHIELAFEHRIYLPSIGICLLVAGALAQLFRFKAWFCGLLAAALVLVLGYNAQQRNAVWQTPETLWSDCIRKSPGKARPYNNLGLYYANKGDYETAKQYMSKALAIDPDYAHALLNFGALLRKTEGDKEARVFYAEIAISHFERALALTPEDIEIRFALGQAYEVAGRPEQAAAAYVEAIKLAPASPVLHIAAAVAFEAAGKPTTALHHAHRAVELDPSDTNAAELLEQLQNLVYTDDAEP